MNDDDFEKFMSWGRYLFWADILFQRFNDFTESSENMEKGKRESKFLALMSQWFASMWVVIEGWIELGLKDARVNELISSKPDYCKRLKRFRNGVFHYQRRVFDEKLSKFLEQNRDQFFWAWSLHYEFKRYLWEWPSMPIGTKEEKQELRNSIEEIIGWMPNDVFPAMKERVTDTIQEGRDIMAAAGDFASLASKELQAALEEAERQVQAVPDGAIYKLLTEWAKKNLS